MTAEKCQHQWKFEGASALRRFWTCTRCKATATLPVAPAASAEGEK